MVIHLFTNRKTFELIGLLPGLNWKNTINSSCRIFYFIITQFSYIFLIMSGFGFKD